MDAKKQDLTPELKQIYERVMNTQVKTGTPAPAAPTAPATPAQPAAAAMPSTPAAPATGAPSPATPPVPAAESAASTATPGQDLAKLEPKPLKEGGDKPFVFSSGKKAESSAAPAAAGIKGGGMKVSPVILAVGLIVLIGVYTVVWLKVFKFF